MLGSQDKRLVICGTSTGFAEDYGHTRIIASRTARQEIWPVILGWMRDRA